MSFQRVETTINCISVGDNFASTIDQRRYNLLILEENNLYTNFMICLRFEFGAIQLIKF